MPTPSLGQQFPDRGSPHLSEEGSSVNSSEMREVAIEIELLSHNSEP